MNKYQLGVTIVGQSVTIGALKKEHTGKELKGTFKNLS